MEKLVRVLLLNSVVGTGFAYGKGENDIPESIARDLIKSGLAAIVGQKPSETAEKPASPAQSAEKRKK